MNQGLGDFCLPSHCRQSFISLVEASTCDGSELVFGFIQNNGTGRAETSSPRLPGHQRSSAPPRCLQCFSPHPLPPGQKPPAATHHPPWRFVSFAGLCLTVTLIFSPAGKRVPPVPAQEPRGGLRLPRGAELKVDTALPPWETSLCSTAFIKEMETCHILSATISDIIQAICPWCVSRNSQAYSRHG